MSAELAAVRERLFEATLDLERSKVQLGLAQAEERAARATAQATYLARRVDELERALGRRQRAAHDRSRGLLRFRD